MKTYPALFGFVAILLLGMASLGSKPAVAADANVVCASGSTLAQAKVGIDLSVRSYAKAGYRISSPTIRTDHQRHFLICVTAAR